LLLLLLLPLVIHQARLLPQSALWLLVLVPRRRTLLVLLCCLSPALLAAWLLQLSLAKHEVLVSSGMHHQLVIQELLQLMVLVLPLQLVLIR
jgi:hypothetical protein